MQRKGIYPWWKHLPAGAGLVFFIIYYFLSLPLPPEVPLHFGFNGQPDSFGSPWLVFGLTTGFSLLYIAISVIIDACWERYEKRKSFNWLSLLDELTVGMLVGINLGYLVFLKNGEQSFIFPWQTLLITLAVMLIPGIILELLRPFRARQEPVVSSIGPSYEEELTVLVKKSSSFVYWESQNPFWTNLVSVMLFVVMLGVAVFQWFEQSMLAMAIIFFLLGTGSLSLYGGLRVTVTREKISVYLGTPGYRVITLPVERIVRAEIHEFSPLADFGGYGIRINRRMRGYFLRGNRGVLLTTHEGKKHLVGSDNPERLLAVIEAVRGIRSA